MSGDEKDLTPGDFPVNLKWANADVAESLERMYEFAVEECSRAITWYYSKKKSKKTLGIILRVFSVVILAAAGILPVLSQMYKDSEFLGSPGWATVAAAVGVLFILLDRFGGYTSGWIRYIQAGQALTNLHATFRIEWEKQRLILQCTQIDQDTVFRSIELIKTFINEVNGIVTAETDLWAREFRKVLTEIEKEFEKKTTVSSGATRQGD